MVDEKLMQSSRFLASNTPAHQINRGWNLIVSSRFLVLFVCILSVVIVPLDLLNPKDPQARFVPHIMRATILAIMLLCATGAVFIKLDFTLGKFLSLYTVFLLSQTLFIYGGFKATFFELSKFLIWPVGTIAFYFWTITNRFNSRLMVVTVSLMLVPAIIGSLNESLEPSSSIYMNAYAYFMLFCLPLLLVDLRSRLKIALVMLAIGTIILTLKRGALVALILSMLAYAAVYRKLNLTKLRYRRFILIFFIFSAVVVFILAWQWDNVLLRWEDVSDIDSIGNNRGLFYSIILKQWLSGNLFNQIFGFGIFSVPSTLENMGYSAKYAHSDWLGIIHDQGIIGLFMFASIHICILKIIHQGIQTKHTLLPVLAMGYVIFICANLYSGCTGAPDSMLLFSMLLGYSSAKITIG